MSRFVNRLISLVALSGAISIVAALILLLMAITLVGEGPVIRGIACQFGLLEDCVRQELQEERDRLRILRNQNEELLARNAEMEALLERLASLDHASSSYVVFYTDRAAGRTVTTGHTFASLLDPDTQIGAHCYISVATRGAGNRRIDLGEMSATGAVTRDQYSAADLAGTGVSQSDISRLEQACQWPAMAG